LEQALRMRTRHNERATRPPILPTVGEREREEELGDMVRNLKEALGTRHGATAAIRLILKTGLLEQFKATAQAKREGRRRGAGEEQE
jgi:hypothetical protein